MYGCGKSLPGYRLASLSKWSNASAGGIWSRSAVWRKFRMTLPAGRHKPTLDLLSSLELTIVASFPRVKFKRTNFLGVVEIPGIAYTYCPTTVIWGPFIGKDARQDVFPLIYKELEKGC